MLVIDDECGATGLFRKLLERSQVAPVPTHANPPGCEEPSSDAIRNGVDHSVALVSGDEGFGKLDLGGRIFPVADEYDGLSPCLVLQLLATCQIDSIVDRRTASNVQFVNRPLQQPQVISVILYQRNGPVEPDNQRQI